MEKPQESSDADTRSDTAPTETEDNSAFLKRLKELGIEDDRSGTKLVGFVGGKQKSD